MKWEIEILASDQVFVPLNLQVVYFLLEDSLSINFTGRTVVSCLLPVLLLMMFSRSSVAFVPTSKPDCSTVVKDGDKNSENGSLLKPKGIQTCFRSKQ